jgi:predicted O-methyltransferase YrrM
VIEAAKARLKRISSRIADYVLDADAHDIQRIRQRRALEESADFVDSEMAMVTPYASKFELFEATLKEAKNEGLYCEFGVHTGGSINFIAERIPQRIIYGFDSFEGLPEDWRPHVKAGHFRLDRLPAVRENVRLIKGWFNETLPPFLHEHGEPAAYLHIDSDLYSSARTVLELFAPRIRPGTVIVFDEYFNYPGWKAGEYKAFQEFATARGVGFEYVGYASSDEQVAVVVREIMGRPVTG